MSSPRYEKLFECLIMVEYYVKGKCHKYGIIMLTNYERPISFVESIIRAQPHNFNAPSFTARYIRCNMLRSQATLYKYGQHKNRHSFFFSYNNHHNYSKIFSVLHVWLFSTQDIMYISSYFGFVCPTLQ